MSIRDVLNKNPAIATGATLAVIIIAVAFMVYSSTGPSSAKAPSRAYFTIDDGKTWFADDITNLAPFQHEGKDAVLVHLYKCKGGDTFAGYLERYSPDAKKKLEEIRAAATAAAPNGPRRSPQDMPGLAMIAQMGKQFKKPGDATWTDFTDFKNSTKMMQIRCPGGGEEIPEPVL